MGHLSDAAEQEAIAGPKSASLIVETIRFWMPSKVNADRVPVLQFLDTDGKVTAQLPPADH